MSGHITKVYHILSEKRRYEEIRSLYINQLAFVWSEGSATEINLDKKIDSFFEGDLEDGAEVLSALWEILNRGGNINAPSNASPSVSQIRFSSLPASHGNVHFA